MQISWNGFGSFTIAAKSTSGDVTLVTNPFSRTDGPKFPRSLAATIVVQSQAGTDADNLAAITPEYAEDKRSPFVVSHAGEFEVRGLAVTGVNTPKKDGTAHSIYRFDAEGLSIGFLGTLDRSLTDQEVEQLGNIDVLIVPSGGKDVLTASAAAEVIAQIEPRLIIPSYVSAAGVESPYAESSALCRELSCPVEATTKFKLTRAALGEPEDDMKMVTFTRA
jgi:hypothetical protein